MPALVLTLLKLIFLALIYLFVWQVARAWSAISVSATRRGRNEQGPGWWWSDLTPSPGWM